MDGAGVPIEFSKGEAGRGPARDQPRRTRRAVEMADRHVDLQERRQGDRVAARPCRSRSWRSTRRTRSARRATSTRACGTTTGDEPLMWDADAPDHLSPAFRGWLGGQLACGRELAWMFAPTVNSYKRYQPESWAPTALAWSVDNRTCGFRVVGHGPSFRLESRIPGGDVNPYLAYAATIAAGLHGIEHGIEPPPRFDGNAYARRRARARAVEPGRGDRRVRDARRSRPTRSAPTCTTTCSTPRARSWRTSTARSPTGNAAATSTSGERARAPAGRGHRPPARRKVDRWPHPHATRLAARLPRRGRARRRVAGAHRSRSATRAGSSTGSTRSCSPAAPTSTPPTYGQDAAPEDLRRRPRRRRLRARARARRDRPRAADARDLPRLPGAQRRARRHAVPAHPRATPASNRTAGPASRTAAARRRSRSTRARCSPR